MNEIMAAMIYEVLLPIVPYAAGSAFGIAVLLLFYRNIHDLFS
jgi:hypothetical protein